MYLEQLHYFITTANVHSMSKASTLMHTSQQNISKAILSLEEELQLKLFHRTSSGVFLTEDGNKVYLLAKKLCESERNIINLAKASNNQNLYADIAGDFITMTIPGYAPLVYDVFQHMKEHCPKLRLVLEERESLDAFKCLLKNPLDCAIFTVDKDFKNFKNDWFWQTYDVHILQQNVLKVMTTVSSPLVQYQSISNKQLEEHLSVIYATSPDQETLIGKLLHDAHINFTPLFHSNSQSACREALVNRNAIMISSDMIFKSAIKTNTDDFILLPMTQKIPVTHLYVVKKSLSPAGAFFHELLLDSFEKVGLILETIDASSN